MKDTFWLIEQIKKSASYKYYTFQNSESSIRKQEIYCTPLIPNNSPFPFSHKEDQEVFVI